MVKGTGTAPVRPLDVPEEAWRLAVAREAVIRPLAAAPRATRAAVERAAAELGLSARQVQRLLRRYRATPVAASLVPARPGMARGTRRLPAAVEAVVEAAIEGFHETRERPRVSALLRRVAADCRAAGLAPPSPKALRARVAARDLRGAVRAREGARAARGRFAPVLGGLRAARPLAPVQVDHTLADVHLADEALRLPLGRPWLTVAIDVHTRCVVGMLLSLDPPSATSVALALAHAALPKDAWLARLGVALPWPMRGVPEAVHLDNAREFHSRALARGCEQHGIRVLHRPPGAPHFGGHVERLAGTLMRRLHALPGTAFSSVAERGDYPAEGRAALTPRELERWIALEVVGPYHREVHRGLGRPPAAAWDAAVAAGWAPREPPDAASFVLDFLPFAERAVRREGLELFGIRYFDGALAGLIGGGARLRVRYDPRDLSAVFAEMPGGGHLRVPYANLARPPVSLWERRLAARRLRAEGRGAAHEEAVFAAIAEQRRTVEAALARKGAARRAAARTPAGPAASRREAPGPGAAQQPSGPGPPPAEEGEEARVPLLTPDDIAASEFWS